MNIANIFGLHIGCRIKHSFMCDNRLHEGTSLLTGVEILQGGTILLEAGFKEYNYQFCKLILKPLSAITDEDKAELEEFIKSDDNKHRDVYDVHWCPDLRGLKYRRLESNINLYDDSPKIMFKLATMGYDIGIIPDEYKEVEE